MSENPNIERIKKEIEEMTYLNQLKDDLKSFPSNLGLAMFLIAAISSWFYNDENGYMWIIRVAAPGILAIWQVGNAVYAYKTRERLQSDLDYLTGEEDSQDV